MEARTAADTQLFLAIGIPVVMNAAPFLLFQAQGNTRLSDFKQDINQRFDARDKLFPNNFPR